jgi:hypothetical protein
VKIGIPWPQVSSHGGLKLVELRCEDEIAFSEAVDLVRPGGDLRLAPAQQNIRVMALRFRYLAYFIHESERSFEIGNVNDFVMWCSLTTFHPDIGRSSICFFSTVPVTSARVVCTTSSPASTTTDSTLDPTSSRIGMTEYSVAVSSLIPLTTPNLEPALFTETL